MATDIDSLIEKKIAEELGKFDTERRRTANQIRDLLQFELEKRPKTVHELRNAISAKKSTVQNHIGHLEELGVVENVEINGQEYWRLV